MAAKEKQMKIDGQVKRLHMQNERLLEKLREASTTIENLTAENKLLVKENKILSEFAEKSASEVMKVDQQHSDELLTILAELKKVDSRIDKLEGKK